MLCPIRTILLPLYFRAISTPCIAGGVHIGIAMTHYNIGRVFNIGQAVLQGIGDGGGCPFCQVARTQLQLVVDIGARVLNTVKICIAVAFFYSDTAGFVWGSTTIKVSGFAGRIRGRFNKPHAVLSAGTVK